MVFAEFDAKKETPIISDLRKSCFRVLETRAYIVFTSLTSALSVRCTAAERDAGGKGDVQWYRFWLILDGRSIFSMIDSDTFTTSAAEPISNRCMAEYTTYCTQALEGFQGF